MAAVMMRENMLLLELVLSGSYPSRMPTFSIAMGTYNGGKFLAEQLESLLKQELAPVELVVGDDGSTDDTLSILQEFSLRAPFPVHITSNSKQLGYGENFLQAASRCKGDWIAFCDQDDVWFPAKLGRCAEAIEFGPADLGLIVHGAIVGDTQLREITRTHWPKAGIYNRLSLPPNLLIQGFRQVIRRSLLNEIPFSERRIPWIGVPEAHDAWACLIALVTGSVAVIGDCLVIYRRHGNNATEAVGLVRKTLLQRIRGKVRDNSGHYQEQADLYDTIAGYLRDRAGAQLTGERTNQFLSASTQIAALGGQFATRAQINRTTSLRKRVQAYGSLARSGAYFSRHGLRVGTAEAAIDLVRVILPGL